MCEEVCEEFAREEARSIAADSLPLETAKLADLVVGETGRVDEGQQVPIQVGFLADHVVGAGLTLGLGEYESVTRHHELADRRITERSSRM